MNYKLIGVIIITLTYLYGIVLEILERRSANNPIPANVADVYDPETYKKWRAYHAETAASASSARLFPLSSASH